MRTALEILIPVGGAIVVLLVVSGRITPTRIARPLGIRVGRRAELPVAIQQGHKLLAAGREQHAYEYLENAIQRFPDDPELRLLYATSLLAIQPKEAIGEAIRDLDLEPDEPVRFSRAANLFAMSLVKRGRQEEALELIEEELPRTKRKEPLERLRGELLDRPKSD
jgi:tetratricopeptide (TPR) repeat protein